MRRICIMMLALCTMGLAQAQVGVYRSSGYGAIKKEKVQRPKKPLPTAMIGISAGGGVTASSHIIYPNGAVGFDFAISATPKFALGMFTQWGILENWSFGLQMVGGDYMNHKFSFVGGVGFALNTRGRKYHEKQTIVMLDADDGSFRHFQYTRYYSTETFTNNGETVTRTVGFNYEGFAPGLAVRVGFVTPKHFYMLFDAGIFPNMYMGILDRYRPADHPWFGVESPAETAATVTISVGYAFGINPKRNKQLNQENAL